MTRFSSEEEILEVADEREYVYDKNEMSRMHIPTNSGSYLLNQDKIMKGHYELFNLFNNSSVKSSKSNSVQINYNQNAFDQPLLKHNYTKASPSSGPRTSDYY